MAPATVAPLPGGRETQDRRAPHPTGPRRARPLPRAAASTPSSHGNMARLRYGWCSRSPIDCPTRSQRAWVHAPTRRATRTDVVDGVGPRVARRQRRAGRRRRGLEVRDEHRELDPVGHRQRHDGACLGIPAGHRDAAVERGAQVVRMSLLPHREVHHGVLPERLSEEERSPRGCRPATHSRSSRAPGRAGCGSTGGRPAPGRAASSPRRRAAHPAPRRSVRRAEGSPAPSPSTSTVSPSASASSATLWTASATPSTSNPGPKLAELAGTVTRTRTVQARRAVTA